MEGDIANEVAALQRLSAGQLRQRFAEVFGEATRAGNKIWLVKRIAWGMQAILTRPYKGLLVQVQILTDGFAYAGSVYPSLSAVAKAVTGSHCNGFLFFRNCLNNKEKA